MPTATPLEIAREYHAQGCAPIPVAYMGKAPTDLEGRKIKNWSSLRLGVDDLPKYFNGKPQNHGLLLGEPSAWLVDVDLDCPEAIRVASHFLPETRTFGRQGARIAHWLFYL